MFGKKVDPTKKKFKKLSRKQVRELLITLELEKLTPEERKEELEDYWDSETYEDKECFLDEELEIFPNDILEDMLQNDSAEDWADPKYDVVLKYIYRFLGYGFKDSYLIDWLAKLGVECKKITGKIEPMEACDCCRYRSFMMGEKAFEICHICMWHHAPGANHGKTLEEAKDNYENFGATEKRFLDIVIKDGPERYERDPEPKIRSYDEFSNKEKSNIDTFLASLGIEKDNPIHDAFLKEAELDEDNPFNKISNEDFEGLIDIIKKND